MTIYSDERSQHHHFHQFVTRVLEDGSNYEEVSSSTKERQVGSTCLLLFQFGEVEAEVAATMFVFGRAAGVRLKDPKIEKWFEDRVVVFDPRFHAGLWKGKESQSGIRGVVGVVRQEVFENGTVCGEGGMGSIPVKKASDEGPYRAFALLWKKVCPGES